MSKPRYAPYEGQVLVSLADKPSFSVNKTNLVDDGSEVWGSLDCTPEQCIALFMAGTNGFRISWGNTMQAWVRVTEAQKNNQVQIRGTLHA